MLSHCVSRNGGILRQHLKNLRLFYCGSASSSRNKPRSVQSPRANAYTAQTVSPKLIARCGLFTFVSVSTLLFGSAVWTFETWRSRSLRLKHGHDKPGEKVGILTLARNQLESLLGRPLQSRDIFWAIVACNVLVFLGHHSPLRLMFLRYFANSPYGPTPALSMFLSVFSHHSLLHLAINMYVLHSFTPTLINMIGPGDFVYLFIGGGIFASFLSLIHKALRRSIIPSLGASGGICAVLGAFCLLQPNAHLCVPFVVDVFPHSFQAHNAVWCLFFLELMASIFLSARSPIDHAAHMGGLLFGMFYSSSGMESIWQRRNAIISVWRKWRHE